MRIRGSRPASVEEKVSLDQPISNAHTCDFCDSYPIVKRYPCWNFEWKNGRVFGSKHGFWATCPKCIEFVETERWPNLAERAFQKYAEKHSIPRHALAEVRTEFSELVGLFAAHVMR